MASETLKVSSKTVSDKVQHAIADCYYTASYLMEILVLGITSKLDYFVDLGIDAIWISPIYKSPMKDFGYDISDFKDIEPIFGTLDDFRNMTAEFRKRGIKLIMDAVPNHSSDLHDWFNKSVHRVEPYTDYYVWRDANGTDANGKPIPPNNWVLKMGSDEL